MIRHPPRSPLFPTPPLSRPRPPGRVALGVERGAAPAPPGPLQVRRPGNRPPDPAGERGAAVGGPPLRDRSEEHTSELQSRQYLVCRLLLEKKKKTKHKHVLS